MVLTDARGVPPEPDPVRPHHDRVALAVLAQGHRPEGVREVGTQLEDVPDLDPPTELHRRSAVDAGVALARIRDVRDQVWRVVTRDVDVEDVPTGPIGARDEVRLQ